MPLLVQYRTVAILAAISALATLFYLSEWTRVDSERDRQQAQQAPLQQQQQQQQQQTPQYQQPGPIVTIPHSNYPQQEPQQQQQQEKPPAKRPGTTTHSGLLVSDKNARIAAMNSQAFVNFCNSIPPTPPTTLTTLPTASSPDSIPTFDSYKEWIDFINRKNSVRQDATTTPVDAGNNNNNNNKADLEFLERPLRNWVVNMTAISEPCDRHIHTSAHCLDFLTREHQYLTPIRRTSEEQAPMNFHIFWRGPFTDKLSLSSFSFLFTQPLDRSHLHLWIDSADLPEGLPEDYTQNVFAAPMVRAPLNQFVTIHAWDQAAEIAYSYGEEPSMQAANDDDNSTKNDENEGEQEEGKLREQGSLAQEQAPVKPVALSDEARFLILNRNGGIYLDADVLLLKDMSPFFDSGIEFAYEWSNTGMYNTAILRLFPGSSVARRILDGAKERELELLKAKFKEQRARQDEQNEENGVEYEEEEGEETDVKKKASSTGPVAGDKIILKTATTASSLLSKREMRPEEIYHPARLRAYLRPEDSKLEGNGLTMMPTPVFDPLWLRVDRAEAKKSKDPERMIEDLHSFPDAFSAKANAVCPRQFPTDANNDDKIEFSAGPEVFLSGAYAHHWHNNWLTSITAKSWMGLMRAAFDDFVEGRRPNLYGEWFQDSIDL
ncbi:hypothetical protein BGW39_010206 [Mortierella sp. 14UC]|nr:hypothetical protein BGW39_010206 [Mortierella sp. 14UC]